MPKRRTSTGRSARDQQKKPPGFPLQRFHACTGCPNSLYYSWGGHIPPPAPPVVNCGPWRVGALPPQKCLRSPRDQQKTAPGSLIRLTRMHRFPLTVLQLERAHNTTGGASGRLWSLEGRSPPKNSFDPKYISCDGTPIYFPSCMGMVIFVFPIPAGPQRCWRLEIPGYPAS